VKNLFKETPQTWVIKPPESFPKNYSKIEGKSGMKKWGKNGAKTYEGIRRKKCQR
jgi:hypothetical protein